MRRLRLVSQRESLLCRAETEANVAEPDKVREKSGIERVLDQVISGDQHQCGLVELPAPTGSGKTYATMSHIADKLIAHEAECRRCVFVTNVKRNLPVDLLRKILEERGHPELIELVANLDSNAGMFANNLEAAKGVMQSSPFRYLEKGRHNPDAMGVSAAEAEFDIVSLPELHNAEKALRMLEGTKRLPDRIGDAKTKAIAVAKEDLEKAEYAFRLKIATVFNSMCVPGETGYRLMSTQEKRNLVEKSTWWKWLTTLYPSVLTFKKRVLFMSVKKLLVKNSPIIEPSESIWESDLLEGSVVFIDEFELSKDVINDSLIEESVNKMADAVSMFRTLMGPALEGRSIGGRGGYASSGVVFTGELLRSPSDDKGAGKRLREEYDEIVRAAEDVYSSLHLNRQFRLSEDLRHKNQSFLFNDFQNHVVATGSSTWAAVHFLETQNQVQLGSGVPPYADDSDEAQKRSFYSVPLLLGRLEGIVGWVVKWIVRVAENYMKVVAEDADVGKRPEISFDQAAETALAELNVMDEVHGERNPTRERVIAMVHDERARRIATGTNVRESPANLCLHQTGFKVHAFSESAQHDTLTRMERCGMPYTAEHKLVELSNRNLVVGISASLDIPSVLGNYDLEYVEGMLQGLYMPLSDDQRALLFSDYERSVSHYDKVNIRVAKVADADEEGVYDERSWLAVFDDDMAARKAFNETALWFASDSDSTFYQKRVLKVCTAFRKFWEAKDARATLCILNALPKAGSSSLDLTHLKQLFASILNSLGIKADADKVVCVLGGSTEEFERLKGDALARLSAGEKLFVMTAYQSAGAGQNLQYKIPEGVTPVKINDRPASDEMDFDCLYLEAPTHTSPVIPLGVEVDEADVLKHILGCEYLYENAEISRGSLLKSVSMALRALGGSGQDYGYKSSESARLLGVKQVYQAAGRLDRTNMKMPTIRIFVDEHLMEGVPLTVLKSCGVVFTPEFEAIVDAFEVGASEPSARAERLARKAEKASDRSRSCINSMLGSGWHDDSRQTWFDLGEQVLKYPTLPDGWNEVPYMERSYYVELEEARTSYRYTSEDDFKAVKVLFGCERGAKSFAVSERAARLDKLMRIEGMRGHFEKHGYATEWKPSTKIMTPVVAESIYKGRLGEVCGRFILEENDIKVADINDAARFEKFDFVLPGEDGDQKVYIDFKHWRKLSDKTGWESEKLVDWVFAKMELIDAQKAVIVNVLPPDDADYQQTLRARSGRKLLIIPALVKSDCSLDETAICAIRRFVDGPEN